MSACTLTLEAGTRDACFALRGDQTAPNTLRPWSLKALAIGETDRRLLGVSLGYRTPSVHRHPTAVSLCQFHLVWAVYRTASQLRIRLRGGEEVPTYSKDDDLKVGETLKSRLEERA